MALYDGNTNMILATVAPGKLVNTVSAGVLVQYTPGWQFWLPLAEYKLFLRDGLVLNPDGTVPTSAAGAGVPVPTGGFAEIPDTMKISGDL